MGKKEELNYFDNFVKNANYALESAKILKEYIDNFDANKSIEKENMVHNLENEADKNQHLVLNYLIKDFLPPIDREDIIMLCHKIDDISDNIDEVVINIDILNVKKLRDDVKTFAQLLLNACEKTTEMLNKFKNIKKFAEIKEVIIEINKLEEDGDKLYQDAIRNLYNTPKDPIEVITWTTLYNCLENCFDSCENVADCVEEILMKNS